MIEKVSFIITIDTEGDNLWSNPRNLTTRNASYISRFQNLCERYKFKPTYLTNYEMANSPHFQEFGNNLIKRNVGEIGMHLHAWDMPPQFALTENDSIFHPYLIEYPPHIIREKIRIMTDTLENTFQKKMLSHRSGRWSFNELYAKFLIEFGYQVDCSVTPYVSWAKNIGDPRQNGGTDYSDFPTEAYLIDLSDISKPGNSALLEVPVSIENIYFHKSKIINRLSKNFWPTRKLSKHFFPSPVWLRPNGYNLKHMLNLLDFSLKNKQYKNVKYVEFMLHSSEFMPGGSPTFKSAESIEKLFVHIEILFSEARNNFYGCTLSEYYEKFIKNLNS